jgi:hypothetical protein
MIPNNPAKILVDPNISQWAIESGMVDITATDALQEQGKFVILNVPGSAGQVIVVTAIARYAWARNNVTESSEGVEMIDPKYGNNFFLYEVNVGEIGKAGIANGTIHLGAWTTAAGATADDVKTGAGSSLITGDPDLSLAVQRGANLPYFIIPAGNPLKVLFSLVPDPIDATAVLPRRFQIGTTSGDMTTQRVDYASIALNGYKMSKQYYDSIMLARATTAPR